jgi:hypothetical protein
VFSPDIINKPITFDILKSSFPSQSEEYLKKLFKNEPYGHFEIDPELNLHLNLTLKLAYNLKDLSQKTNVKQFFFTRFKR